MKFHLGEMIFFSWESGQSLLIVWMTYPEMSFIVGIIQLR